MYIFFYFEFWIVVYIFQEFFNGEWLFLDGVDNDVILISLFFFVFFVVLSYQVFNDFVFIN